MTDDQKDQIIREIRKTVSRRSEFIPRYRNDPFTDLFLEKLEIPLEFKNHCSTIIGLKTSLGSSFFENVTRILTQGRKVSFTKSKNNLLEITERQHNAIQSIMTFYDKDTRPNLKREDEQIFQKEDISKRIPCRELSFDVLFRTEASICALEIKNTHPNKEGLREHKEKILCAKAGLFWRFPDKPIKFKLCFPFDPTGSSPTDTNKQRFLDQLICGNKYFDPKEILIGSEFWAAISGEADMMNQILNLIDGCK